MKVVGIIGTGTIAELYYINTLRKLGFKNICVWDEQIERAKQFAQRFKVQFTTLDELLEQSSIVIITVPVYAHTQLILQAIEKKAEHIICEKPLLTSLLDYDLVYQRSRERNIRISVAHIRKIFPGIELAHQHLNQYSYGKLMAIKAWEGSRMNYQSKSNYIHQHALGGVLFDTGSHVIDSILFVLNWHLSKDIEINNLKINTDKIEPSHHVQLTCEINQIPFQLILSRREVLSNKITLTFENAAIDIPLSIKPNLIVTHKDGLEVISTADESISYMSEAFSKELYEILNLSDAKKWDISTCKNTTFILHKIANAL